MGCWNGTCGLTNLPLRAGDKVMGVLVRIPYRNKLEDMSGSCYSTDLAWPVTAGFEGEYNDYGGIEDLVPSPVLEEIEKRFGVEDACVFINDVVERDEFYYPGAYWDMVDYHKSVAKAEGKEYAEPVKGEEGEGRDGLGLWMCHKSAWDNLTRSPELKTGWKGVHPFNYYKDSFSDYCKKLKAAVEMEERWAKMDEEGDLSEELKAIREEYKDDYFFSKLGIGRIPFAECVGSRESGSDMNEELCGYARMLEEMIIDKNIPVDDPNMVAFVDRLCESRAMNIVIGNLRKTWYPQSGKGSQANPYAWYYKLIESMEQIMRAQEVETLSWQEDELEEGEEPYSAQKDWGW